MTREEAIAMPKGSLLFTPFEPRAIVQLIKVEEETAVVRFTHEHGGYPQGSLGRYYLSELTPWSD